MLINSSDHEKSFCQKHFAAIKETDGDVEFEEMEDDDCDILSDLDTEMKGLKVRTNMTVLSNLIYSGVPINLNLFSMS